MPNCSARSVHPGHGPYAEGLDRNRRQPRAADAAVVPGPHGRRSIPTGSPSCTAGSAAPTASCCERCLRAGLGAASGAASGPGDTVAAMLPNIPAMLEAHHGVPMCGAVLNALNTRLDAAALAFILQHGEAKALLTDTELAPVDARGGARWPAGRCW